MTRLLLDCLPRGGRTAVDASKRMVARAGERRLPAAGFGADRLARRAGPGATRLTELRHWGRVI